MRKDSLVLVGVLVIAISGFAFLLLATPMGIGISPDSASYISAARNILSGKGLSVSYDLSADANDLQGWIKERWGYPTLLAAAGALGTDPLVASRWVSAIFFAGNIFLAGFILLRQPCGRNWLLPLTASLLVMTAVDSTLLAHSMAWSEPPFIFFGFLGIYFMAGYLDNGRAWRLLCAAVSVFLALAMRFAGVAFVAAGIFALAVIGHRRFREKALDIAIFSALSGGPFALWLCKNASNLAGGFSFHGFTPRHFKTICKALVQWLPIGSSSRVLSGILLIVICVTVVLALIKIRGKRRPDRPKPQSSSSLTPLLCAFIFFFLFFYAAVITLVSPDSGIDTRNYSPIFVATLILALCVSGDFLGVFIRDEGLRAKVLAGLCAVFVIGYAARSAIWFSEVRKDGQGFASRIFRESEVLRLVKDFPYETLIFTNLPEAVYIVTGKSSYLTPRRNLLSSEAVRSEVDSELNSMYEHLRRSKGKLVFVEGLERPFLVPLDALIDRFHLKLVAKTRDGAIYELPD